MGHGLSGKRLPWAGWAALVPAAGFCLVACGADPSAVDEATPTTDAVKATEVSTDDVIPVQGNDVVTRGGRETVASSEATIDWASARSDLAASGRAESGDVAAFQIASGPDAPPVPVLLPSGIVRPANADRPTYRPLDDGYYAKYPGVAYDLTVSGTNEWYSGGTQDREDPAAEMVFTATMTGAQVALNRYGAAYLMEFECNRAAGFDANGCIDEVEALAVAEQLVITGSR